ncbi:MAG TPA: VWA domain-containing protein [Thermoanaerobaculia bacterium]|nr:VWA domain-containing protein [Thermoanaerobaculia bacterium]
MRRIVIALFLIIAAATATASDDLRWHTDPADALNAARAARTMLFVHFRASCGDCGRIEAELERAVTEPMFVRALESFVLLRVSSASPPHPVVNRLRSEESVVAIFDASGEWLTAINIHERRMEAGEELLLLRANRESFAEAAELRLGGNAAAADMLLAKALSSAMRQRDAALRFERAASAFAAEGNREAEQFAIIGAAMAWHAARGPGRPLNPLQMLDKVLRNPISDAVAADAHLALGAIRNGSSKMKFGAIQSYRKAYELAPAGSVTEELARAALERIDSRPLPSKAPRQTKLRILPPARMTFTGTADFVVEADPSIVRVDVFLDEQKVGSADQPPFRVAVDVGSTPRMRTVKARGFDRSGNVAGETVVTVNDRADAFFVTIAAPATATTAGATHAELDVRVPPGRTLRDVAVSWNERPVATLTSAPFRARLDVPSTEFGYLRAVATLDDGTTAEATRIYNARTASATAEIGAVTVIAMASDAQGNRLAGLSASDFSILDEETPVTPALRSAEDEPVTIGIAIDSSSSMRGNLLYAIEAAAVFLDRALRTGDQAFVVAFDTAPRLLHPRSGNRESLRESILSIAPVGGTSIFDGVTFALQQFQGVPGKKALVVISDGREGSSVGGADVSKRMAGAVGVPIYIISPKGGERGGHALLPVSELTGGTMLHALASDAFGPAFDRLIDEIRGQYILSFERPPGIREGTWRSIRVSVNRPGATVRSIRGYRAN